MKQFSIGLIIIFLCMNIFANDFEKEFIKKVKSEDFWISSTIVETPESHLIVLVNKKWSVKGDYLVELTKNSVDDSDPAEKKWMKETIDLNTKIEFSTVASVPFEKFEIEDLENNAFVMHNDKLHMLFYPSNGNNALLKKTKGQFIHMWAPVAFLMSDMGIKVSEGDFLPSYLHEQKTPLRHNLANQRNIVLSQSFPTALIPAIEKAIDVWNNNLGTSFYKLSSTPKKLNPFNCFASQDLCIFWDGNENLSWAGVGGLSSISYDPAVGWIHGGVIKIFNTYKDDPIKEVPTDIILSLKEDPSHYLSSNIWANGAYRYYKNPDPIGFISALTIHEMGHDFGFRHYFGGSLGAHSSSPSDTVMDYLPYPIFNKMQRLGERDLAKLQAIYADGHFGTWGAEEMECSDAQTLSNPLCKPQDVGDPVIYYSSILDKFSPFHKIQPSGGGLGVVSGPTPIVNILSQYLIPNPNVSSMQKWYIETKLCLHPKKDEIIEHLQKLPSKTKLQCPII